uniref:Tyrosine specific protein phosphatases domain-containing protein n=1 Tax=Eucampia antarctica TaxID=49252 RepID=A0A7S2VXM8_9STRA|mmetsp:Transcript_10084/g.9777  ORF Transcript_10084/g.9777 Transcript_10084/m.9777 type:complete len:467 (+) Transcript_10084:124-1524(+)|eukprot:CAMPEP_0197836756 /NCGR_PEP_ID=MMETSP1437-20131217/29916_1 /TAXON_ID=49252 ORGANISM="Eucampia antarctica, Strain CCMP1452" /NCGR_SAMPLE_ID=MMETSP1437 /ASSEMBLY_ACC=CAM_ASM_001096 /LENGTH=466 /DNA_ID=CAMNT_0043443183 /DNA_START=105 /DNA_END=1505 /DNA_ORIENTATION=-
MSLFHWYSGDYKESSLGRKQFYTLFFLISRVLIFNRTHAFVVPRTSISIRNSAMVTTLQQTANGKKYEELEDEEFKARTKQLCLERNMPLEKVKNCRDLSTVKNSVISPNKIIRMGRVSDATEVDLEKYISNIKTLVDLRSPTELKEDVSLERPEVYADYVNLVYEERRKGGVVRELAEGEPRIRSSSHAKESAAIDTNDNTEGLILSAVDVAHGCEDCDADQLQNMAEVEDSKLDKREKESSSKSQNRRRYVSEFSPNSPKSSEGANRKERHFVSIMNEFKYVLGTLSKLRKRDIFRAVIKSPGAIVSRRVRTGVKDVFLDEINQGGLIMLNELLLRFGAPGIKYVLQICADETRHPVGFYCTAGKDRTGAIAAIILALMGVPDEDIIEDYSLSANVYAEMNDHKAMVGALSQRNLDAKTFLGAPPHVMRDTLVSIRKNYGSIEGYLDFIGFDEEQREKLKKALQ